MFLGMTAIKHYVKIMLYRSLAEILQGLAEVNKVHQS